MNRRRPAYLNPLIKRTVISTALMMIAVAADPASLPRNLKTKFAWVETIARAQDESLKDFSDEYAKLEREGLEENFDRKLCYMMLLPHLPSGTKMTSGYRSPEKQLDLILRMARARGIPTRSNASVGDEESWQGALMALREKGIIIASPMNTPHASDEAVFDLSGAPLSDIRAGLDRAEKAGIIKFKRPPIVENQNNAVHVEVEFFKPKAMRVLGRKTSPQGTAPVPDSSPSKEEQGRIMLQQLEDRHNSEPDPEKKIAYDGLRKTLLDPAVDAEKIRALDNEIKEHRQEARQLAGKTALREAVARVSEALRDDRYEDAEREAQRFAKENPGLPQAQSMLRQVRMRRLVGEAQDALYASDDPGCSECEKANELIGEALKLYPKHEGALSIKEEVDACLKPCGSKSVIVVIILGLLTFVLAASGIGFFLVSRSGGGTAVAATPHAGGLKAPAWIAEKVMGARGWTLEVVEGAGRGQVFPLDKEKIVVGSQGPPGGTADIVILDAERKISRQHCLIMQNGRQFYLLDESTNGTKINGHEVQRGVVAEFRSGDQITLADVAVLTLKPR